MKYRFWLICGVISLLPLGGWFTTTSRLKEEFQPHAEIKSKFETGRASSAHPTTPISFSNREWTSMLHELETDVQKAWKTQYDRQGEILVWPKELGDEFIQQVDKYRPLESLPFPTAPARNFAASIANSTVTTSRRSCRSFRDRLVPLAGTPFSGSNRWRRRVARHGNGNGEWEWEWEWA